VRFLAGILAGSRYPGREKDTAQDATGREREIQHLLQPVNNIQYPLHVLRERTISCVYWGDWSVKETDSVQQIMKYLDKMQHSLYWLSQALG
jgi:hypothetical protein